VRHIRQTNQMLAKLLHNTRGGQQVRCQPFLCRAVSGTEACQA
jgi:LSD1 subclass zinc finger protein